MRWSPTPPPALAALVPDLAQPDLAWRYAERPLWDGRSADWWLELEGIPRDEADEGLRQFGAWLAARERHVTYYCDVHHAVKKLVVAADRFFWYIYPDHIHRNTLGSSPRCQATTTDGSRCSHDAQHLVPRLVYQHRVLLCEIHHRLWQKDGEPRGFWQDDAKVPPPRRPLPPPPPPCITCKHSVEAHPADLFADCTQCLAERNPYPCSSYARRRPLPVLCATCGHGAWVHHPLPDCKIGYCATCATLDYRERVVHDFTARQRSLAPTV